MRSPEPDANQATDMHIQTPNPAVHACLRGESLFRVMRSLIADELGRQRHLRVIPRAWRGWTRSTRLFLESASRDGASQDSPEVDSIELLAVASRVGQFFHVDRGGFGPEADHDGALVGAATLGGWCDLVERSGGASITVQTSGSSGMPKPCTHAMEELRAEASEHARVLAMFHAEQVGECAHERERRVVALTPCHHIYGLMFGVLVPEALGASVIERVGVEPSRVRRELRAGDLVVSHPAGWRLLVESTDALPAIVAISSGAPLPAELHAGLVARGARVLDVYGCSELGGIGRRSEPGAAFELLGRWKSLPAEAPDQLCSAGERRFSVEGRRDGAVQVAGINVFPGEVARVLREHPRVVDCVVRPMSPGEGDRLKAFIVARDATPDEGEASDQVDVALDELRAELDAFARARLSTPQRPVSWTFGRVLPTTASGKPGDWRIT
ncbi:MAG: AMP-binding protein [Planctomycetota bacterium]|nr:AMP-binding protein [Planctomycetota bacterium]